MAASDEFEALRQQIKEVYPGLPPAIQRIAKFALDAPVEIALQPLRTVAARSGAGATSVMRFARLLGFPSYGAFRDRFRAGLRRDHGGYAIRARNLQVRDAEAPLAGEIATVAGAGIAESVSRLDPAILAAAARTLAGARRIYLIGARSAYAPAFYAYYLLSMFRPAARLVEGRFGMLAEELDDPRPQDAALVFSYAPYARQTIECAAVLHAAGVRTIAVTDSPVSPLAQVAAHVFEVATASPSFYISFVPTFCVLEAILAATAVHAGEAGIAALRRGDELRERSGTYWTNGPARE